MRKFFLLAALCCPVLASAQTTTYTGTVRDLANNTVTSGKITWQLNAPSGGVIPGTGSFTSSIVSCGIDASGHPVAISDGVSPCVVTSNTALTPTGTSYTMCTQPNFVSPGSCIVTYATGGTVDISTIVPTPATQPSYGVASTQIANTWQQSQIFTNGLTSQGPIFSPTVNNIVFANQFAGSDMCAKLSAALASLGSGWGMVDARGLTGTQTCASSPFSGSAYSNVLILVANVTLTSTYAGSWSVPANTHILGGGYQNAVLQFTPSSAIDVAMQLSGSNIEIEGVSIQGGANVGRLVDARGLTFTRIHNNFFSGAGRLPAISANSAVAIGGTNGADQWVTDNVITHIGLCGGSISNGSFDIFSDYTASNAQRLHVNRNTIYGSCTNTSIGLNDTQNSEVDDNTIDENNTIRSDVNTSGGYGVMLYTNLGRNAYNDVSRNEVKNTAGAGIYLQICDYCTTHGNRLSNVGQQEVPTSLPVAGIAVNGGAYSTITGNVVKTSGQDGITFTQEADGPFPGPEIANNTITGAARYCALLNGAFQMNFHDNIITTCGNDGIESQSSATMQHTQIAHNTLSGLAHSGIAIYNASDTQITENGISGWSGGFYGIIVGSGGTSSNVAVSSNNLNGSGTGIDVGNITYGCSISKNSVINASPGVDADTGAVNCQIDGNILHSTASGIFTTSGTKSNVTNNRLDGFTTAITIGGTDQRMCNQTVAGAVPSDSCGGTGLAPFTAVTITSNAGTLATAGAAFTNGTVVLSHTSTTTINVSGLASGASFNLRLNQDSTGGNTLTLGTGCTWLLGGGSGFVASTTPTLTAPASGVNVLSAIYDGTNCLYNVK